MKKQLSLLLVLPFLLGGCSTGNSGSKDFGELTYGDAVLTDAQKEAFILGDNSRSVTSNVSVLSDSISISSTATYSQSFSYAGQFITYELSNSFYVYSMLTGKRVNYIPDVTIMDSYSFSTNSYTSFYSDSGFEVGALKMYREDSSTSKTLYSTFIYDAYGNELYTDVDSEYGYPTVSFDWYVKAVYPYRDNTSNPTYTYYMIMDVSKTGENPKTVYYKYSDDMTTVEKVDSIYPAPLHNPYAYMFTVQDGDTSTKYFYNKFTSDSKIILEVNKEGETDVKRYVIPASGYFVVDQYLIYQQSVLINDHDLNYDYCNGTNCYRLSTYRLDLATGSEEEIKTPMVISNVHELTKNIEYDTVAQIGPYVAVEFYTINNDRTIDNTVKAYVVDKDLVLHDNVITYYGSYYKFGDYYYAGSAIFNKDRIQIKSLPYSIVKIYGNGALVRNNDNYKYGFIDFELNELVQLRYSNYFPMGNDQILFSNSINDAKLFNYSSKTASNLTTVDNKHEYETNYLSTGIFMKYGLDTQTSEKDEVYHGNNLLVSYSQSDNAYLSGIFSKSYQKLTRYSYYIRTGTYSTGYKYNIIRADYTNN